MPICGINLPNMLCPRLEWHIIMFSGFYLDEEVAVPAKCLSTIIYSIICLKSVDVRIMQFVILAHSPREMSQTDRIHPRYFLLRARVSIRPRYFVNAKNPYYTYVVYFDPRRCGQMNN